MSEAVSEPHNLQAIKAALQKHDIGYSEVEPVVEGGWAIEILDLIQGQALDDLVKIADTSQHVVITVAPSVGMIIATEGAV